jgi:hypothetical protein
LSAPGENWTTCAGSNLDRLNRLQGLAALAAGRHDDERAAVLRGAGAAMDRHPNPVVDDGLECWFAPARERLGDDRWGELVQQGGGLSVEQAVALATGEPSITAPM